MNEVAVKGKNIVLCSDGTGNSGGKGNGTNVWRLFQAVDLSKGDQVAFHDDGVGTQDFKLLKAIGGATGLGLGRNIRELYASLVRVYDPGDRVYLFGFSRGAYTIRSLANFIHMSGILDRHAFDTPEDLERKISGLYAAYRRSEKSEKPADKADSVATFHPHKEGVIAFLGVWDTVDAIGVPFDGLRDLFRKYTPWRHHDYKLNPSIKAAFHALAIDDERKSFHPNMFNESERATDAVPVEQVWFSGVHSNVGGGYPKDQIAYISLDWMMRQAADKTLYEGYEPLRFHDGVLKEFEDAANPHGKLYDSRSGLAAYYRPSPRNIQELCDKANAGKAKVHASAMVRIGRRTGGYAPINIPEHYDVVDSEEQASSVISRPGSRQLGDNWEFMRRAMGLTRWQKCLYCAFLLVTLLLVVVISWQMYFSPGTEISGLLPWAAVAVKSFVPDFLAGAVDAAFLRVGWLIGFVGLFGLLIWNRRFLKQLVRDLAGMGWRAVYLEAALKSPQADDDSTKKKRRQDQLNDLEEVRNQVGGSVSAALAWAAGRTGRSQWIWGVGWIAVIAIGVYLVGWRHPASDWADACSVSRPAEVPHAGTWRVEGFETSDPCFRTGIPLQKGKKYAVQVTADGWFDSSIKAGPGGFENKKDGERWYMKPFKPFLRVPKSGYFVLMGQVIGKEKSSGSGEESRLVPRGEPFAIGNAAQPVRARETGELVLFVNDALCPLCPPGTYGFYANNKGTAVITVKQAK